jgi:hypothetical protein
MGPSGGPRFKDLAEWLPIYEEYRRTRIEKRGFADSGARRTFTQGENRAFLKRFREEREARGVFPKPRTMSRETAAARLLLSMLDDSANWDSESMPGQPYMLWASIAGSEPNGGRVGSSERRGLKELAALANGWFIWPEQADEADFVPMDRWLFIFRQFVEEERGKSDGGDTE